MTDMNDASTRRLMERGKTMTNQPEPDSAEATLPSPWWADSDREANWLRRHDTNNQDELFWCDARGADYLNALEARARLAGELAIENAQLRARIAEYEKAEALDQQPSA